MGKEGVRVLMKRLRTIFATYLPALWPRAVIFLVFNSQLVRGSEKSSAAASPVFRFRASSTT